MESKEFWSATEVIIEKYTETVQHELSERWKNWSIDLAEPEKYEVIGALLARQVTLALQLANAPSIWNGHVAPLLLRSMVDNYINLAWILDDPSDRSRKFILYGLGQEKLNIEHIKAHLEGEGGDAGNNPIIKQKEAWLDSQRFSFLTEFNVGSWSGLDARTMAQQANCVDLYNYAYSPFSTATHNMWNHVARYNLTFCDNPLHRYHRVPVIASVPPDIDYVYRAAKYVNNAFRLFDEKMGVKINGESAFNLFLEAVNELGEKIRIESETLNEG